jgi:hypothetical protein
LIQPLYFKAYRGSPSLGYGWKRFKHLASKRGSWKRRLFSEMDENGDLIAIIELI